MNKLIFLDIETMPTGIAADPATLKPPGNLKRPETIAEWYRSEAPAIAEKAYRDRALDSMQGEILCIGWSCENQGGVVLDITEELVIKKFSSIVEVLAGQWKVLPTYVGWNCAAFDLPWLWRKAIQYGVKPLRDSINRDRYRGNVIDLMLVWAADHRDFRKMADVAAFLGIEDCKGGLDGSMIYDLCLEGRYEEIKNYCARDVKTVQKIYEKIFG